MKHKNVPVQEIEVPEVRVTAVYDDELQDQLASSLETVGQLQPIVLVEKGEGYELVDGLHRLIEAKNRGDKTIAAVVYPGDSGDALLLNLVTNRLRGKTKASEMVQVIGELTNVHHMDSDQIVARTGMTRDYIERLWKISEAHPAVVDALDKELIGVGVAFQISRLPDLLSQEEYVRTSQVYHMSVTDIKGFVDQVITYVNEPQPEPKQEPHEPAPPPACEGCHSHPSPNLLVMMTLCPSCYGSVYRKNLEEVARQETNGVVDVEGVTP